jgi:thioredoxin 1
MGGGGAVHEVPDAESFRALMEAAGDGFVVVDFSAKWCGPCKMIAPIYKQMAEQHPDVTFAKVDVDENEEVAAFYQVRSMPTFVFLRHGKVVTNFAGADEKTLRQTLASVQEGAYDTLRRGTSVTVHGLCNEAYQQHNEKVGTVLNYDWSKGRYNVNMGGVNLALRPANLVPIVQCVLRQDAGQHAGETVRIVGFSRAGASQYKVKLPGGETADVATDLVDLPVGTTVYVDGLVSQTKYNGRYGKIEGVDGGRYVVQILTNEQVKLKPANVYAGKPPQ